jgi:dihydroorotase
MRLTITKPDDFHVHVRDGIILHDIIPNVAKTFKRALIMPNLKPAVTNVAQASYYKKRIEAALRNPNFEPLMSLYLTDSTTVKDVLDVAESKDVYAFKLYPANATTNSSEGVTNIRKLYPIFEEMEKYGLPLLVHAEVTDSDVDIFDRELEFIDLYLENIVATFHDLRVVMEHITTTNAVEFVRDSGIAATITPQHLMYNRNNLLVGGIKPHLYCLPILKSESNRQSLIAAAISGNSCFFLGTDSAPHWCDTKENACGCAGCFSSPIAMQLYAQIFEEHKSLDKLEGFASHFGSDYYGLNRNTETITLIKEDFLVPSYYQGIVPLEAGKIINWSIEQ